MTAVCIAFKAHMGWVNAVAVAMHTSKPKPLRAGRIDLFGNQGREVVEPYHVAGGWDGLDWQRAVVLVGRGWSWTRSA